MTIAVQDKNPQLAITIDNTIADTFAADYWRMAGSRYDDVTRRLNADVEKARIRLLQLDRHLEAAVAGASYVGSAASMDQTAQHLGELNEQRAIVLGQYVTDRTNLQADLDEPRKTAKIVRYEILHNNAAYHEAESSVSRDVAQYTTTRASVNANYPGIAGFNDKLIKEAQALEVLRSQALAARDAYSPSLAEQIVQTAKDEAAFKGDTTKLAAFDEQIRMLKSTLSSPAARTTSLGALRAERDAAEAQLQNLSIALSSALTSSAQASSLGDVVVVDRATEARPTLVGPLALLALGLTAALGMAIAVSYLAELLVPRLLGSADVESVYGRPVLATLRAQ
jgi:capsular polysaccharide biosynthesis protein